jgi:hypothetical protein
LVGGDSASRSSSFQMRFPCTFRVILFLICEICVILAFLLCGALRGRCAARRPSNVVPSTVGRPHRAFVSHTAQGGVIFE